MFPGVLQRLPLSVCLCCSLCTPVSASQKHPRMMLIDCWKLHSFRSTIFLTASQKVTLSERKVSHLSQQEHVGGDADGRSARLLLTLNIPPCPKKREKASVKVSTSLLVRTRFTWEPQSVTVQTKSWQSWPTTNSTRSAPTQ